MRSKMAEELKREQRERFAAMTPEARAAMAYRLGVDWLERFMAVQGIDRRAAMSALRRSRRAGRRPSHSMDGRE